MSLQETIDAYNLYLRAVKKHRNLRNEIAQHIAKALPPGLALEWAQGEALYNINGIDNSIRFEVGSPLLFENTDSDEVVGYYIDDGAAEYGDEVPGVTKTKLRALIKVWNEVPRDLLDKAYGDAIVRVLSDGTVTTQEH